MDKITVLIPTYDRETLLGDCLSSILNQTHTNLEVLVYDDGSTDNTEAFMRLHPDKRIRYIRNDAHKGVSFARNALLCAAQTRYCCWQDSDDMSNIHRIARQLELIKRYTRAYVTTNHIRLFEKNRKECFRAPMANTTDRGGSFASIMFDIYHAPRFVEGIDCGGGDMEWVRSLKKSAEHTHIAERLYYIRLCNRDRIGVMKRRQSAAKSASDAIRRNHREGQA